MNKTRKYLALFVASICLSLQAWAETFSVANTEGVFICYETTSETTVRVIKGESNYAGNVVIPTSVSYNEVEYTVDAIGEYAFFECPNLESVEIPNSVQTIGGRAFENCSALASVTIGESVTRIGYDAFKHSGLTSVVLPNSLEYIDYHAFDGCANLEYVSLGLSIQTIRENVFQGCYNLATVNVGSISSLMNIEFTNNDSNPLTKAEHLYLNGEEVTELVIPDGVTEIPANFFSGLTGITSVVIPGSVTYIGDNAFSGCTSLASVTFPDSPFTLGQNVFANTSFQNNAEDGVIYVGNIVYGYQGSMPENASIVIKEGTTAIVENAFLNCTGLTSIEVPATVTYIGKNAFAGTTWYETQPDGPIYINKVFYKYKGTMALNSEYEVADGTVSISGEAFKGYTQLSKLVLPSSLTTIGEQAFHGCLGLADLSIGEGLTHTGNDAFGGCSNLNNIYASNVAQLFFLSSGSGQSNPFALARHLFVNDEELTELVIPDGVEELNEGFFYNFGKNVTSVTIPNSVTKIGGSAFKDWTNLAQVTFGESLKAIGDWAFAGCSALTRIDLPNSLESIWGYAFYDCSNLSYITLGDSIQNIGWDAFRGCDSLIVNVSRIETFFGEIKMDNDGANLFLKAEELCVNDEPVVELEVPNTVSKIRGDVFRGSKIEKLIIPNSVKTIDERAFSDCKALSYISLGDSLDSIGTDAFYECNSLTINVSKLETLFKDYTFEGGGNPFEKAIQLCINDEPIVDLEVPNTVTKIPGGIFNGKKIASVTMPDSVKTIEPEAFYGCVELSLVSLGNSLESIGEGAFSSCKALTSIDIPNSVKVIGGNAFSYCEKLTLVSFGNYVDSIGQRAFANCYALESIELPNSIKTISNGAFCDCVNLNTIIFGNNLQVINAEAFKGCRSLTSIKVPDSVIRIGWGAFWGCSNLSSVTLGSGLRYIEDYAFANCHAISQTIIPSIEWLFSIPVSGGMSYLFSSELYIGQQPLTSLTIPDNVTVAPILPELYRTTITSLNTGNGLKTIPEGRSESITQVTLGSNITKVECEFPNALIVVSNASKAPTITEETFPKCMFDNGGEGVVVLLDANVQKVYSKAKVWEGMQMSNQNNQVAVQVSAPGSIGTDLALGLRMPVAKVVGLTVSGEINEQDIMQMNKNMMSLLYLDLSDAIVDKIPDDAFNGKQQLLSLVLPKTTKVVGNSAFKGCNGIEELQMPMDVTEIGDEAFIGTSIRSMDFNYALKKIGNRAFANTPLKEISFQNKVESIGNEAFYGCNLDQELLFSETLSSIGDRAFDGQRGIRGHLTIPESVASVGEGAFRGTSISTVFISGKMTTLESSVFANCNLLDVVYIPDNITNINSSAFLNCSSLKNLRLSQNIEEIGSEAFRSIPIRSVNVPENAKTLKSYSFADCSNLRFVTLPSTMISLEEGVFWNCRQLMNLTTKALTPPVVMSNTFRGVNTDKCIISMPTVSIEAYITAPYWGRFMEMRNDIAVETEGKGSISFVSGDTEEDDDAASARTTRAGNATETMEDNITLVDDGSSLYVPQNGVVRFHITPAEGETILSATFDGVDITSQIIDGVFVTTADKLSSKLEVNFSQVTKTSQLITWEQSFEPLMVGDKVALSATASSGLPVTFDFADENSKECASLSNNTLTITKSGVIAIIALQKGDDEYASVATEMKYIRAYEYGDANADMEINSADLATAVDYAIGNNPKEFLFKAADVNKDSNVNVADVSGVVDIVLSAPATTDDVNGNAREVAISNNVLSVLDGNRLNFYVTQEKESFLTFQCDVRITDDSMLELDIAGNPIVSISNNMGTKNHIAVARLLTDGYIRVLVYSTDNTPIPNNYSFALHIGHELNESDIEISNAGYSYRDNGQITYASLNSGVVTGLDNVTGNIDQTDIKVNGNTISFNSPTDCLMPVVSVNGMTYMLNVKAGYNEFTINKGVYVIGKNKVIIK